MIPHIRHPRDERQDVCGVPAEKVQRWETDDPPRAGNACLTLLPDAARPDDDQYQIGDVTLIESLRTIVAQRQNTKIDGVHVDSRSAEVTATNWDRLNDNHRRRLLALPPHELIMRCIAIYTSVTDKADGR